MYHVALRTLGILKTLVFSFLLILCSLSFQGAVPHIRLFCNVHYNQINYKVILKIEKAFQVSSSLHFPNKYFKCYRPTFSSCHKSIDIKTVIQRMAMKELNNMKYAEF